ncbi:MAG: carbohydrate ABC transporter permease [Bacillota bacterium]
MNSLAQQVPRRQTQVLKNVLTQIVLYLPLILAALVTIFPFWYMLVLATKSKSQIFSLPPPMWFGNAFRENYASLFARLPFWRNFWNSIYIAGMGTALTLFLCSLAGFGFAMYRFKGRELLFKMMLATFMIPGWVMIIPTFLMMKAFGWYNTPRALYLPGAASAMGIFMMRQYISSAIPLELVDSARMDGCTEFGIYWRIALPLIKPALGALGIMSFVGQWNSFVMPLVMLRDVTTYTVPVALRSLQGMASIEYAAIMVGSVISTFPVLLVFIFMSKQFISGLTRGAIQGF